MLRWERHFSSLERRFLFVVVVFTIKEEEEEDDGDDDQNLIYLYKPTMN